MATLLTAIGLFIALHMIPALPPVRLRLIAWFGRGAYLAGYILITLGLLGWIGVAYAEAETELLWAQAGWMRWVPNVVMPVACILGVGALTQVNPFSVALKKKGFDPARPGIVSVTRHPLIWALILWSAAHVLPNGDTASVVLFGFFALASLPGPWSLDKKARRELGEDEWSRLAGPTSSLPFGAILSGRTRLDWRGIGLWRMALGLALYAGLAWSHPLLLGVEAWP